MKKLLGITLIALPLVGAFIALGLTAGWSLTLDIFATAIIATGITVLGFKLIFS